MADEDFPKLWTPDSRGLGASVSEVMKAYSLFLEVRYPDHYTAFRLRTLSDPNGANAEAVIFSWLRWHGFSPTPTDVPGLGGPDFLCTPPLAAPFLLEVTSLNPDAVSQRSGWPDELNDKARLFAMITPNLWSKAKNKASQLGGYQVARVLAVSLAHIGADVLLSTLAAQWLMTSEPKLSVPVGTPATAIREVTDLSKSAFLAIREGNVVPMRQTISAVLLVALWDQELHAVGLLHPEPAVAFDYRSLGELPFLRLEWPVKERVLRTEWVVAKPAPRVDRHVPVSLTTDDLRGE